MILSGYRILPLIDGRYAEAATLCQIDVSVITDFRTYLSYNGKMRTPALSEPYNMHRVYKADPDSSLLI
jgi:hypothetical protein